jgi:hypothetical protein
MRRSHPRRSCFDYALGGGWPLDGVVENSHMDVDWVRVWSLQTAPNVPSGLTATAASRSQINLSWTDNSGNETGFKVERATDSNFTQNLTLLTTTAANVTGYSSTGLSAGSYRRRDVLQLRRPSPAAEVAPRRVHRRQAD